MSFLPKGYEVKSSKGAYLKLKDGDNKIRILSNAIIGWEYFNMDNKPIRNKEMFSSCPGIKPDGKQKEFWAFIVFDYTDNQIKILQISQNSIKGDLFAYYEDEEFGDPLKYDIKIFRSGSNLDTKYSVKALPPKEFVNKEVLNQIKEINLEALFIGENPFTYKGEIDESF